MQTTRAQYQIPAWIFDGYTMEKLPYFTIECGPNKGEVIQIVGESFLIGRYPSSDYIIPNEKISRRHIRVFRRDERWMLEDLQSRNHTRLNGAEMESAKPELLASGDEIQLAAQIVLRFYDPESTMNDENRILRDGLWMDITNHDVYVHNKRLDPKLSPCQYRILSLLYDKSLSKSLIASKEEIEATGWPEQRGINHQMIDAEIHRLRKRLTELEPEHDFIQSERGFGRYFVQFSRRK